MQQAAQCGTPHLALGERPEISDYTGVVQVTGKRVGLVAFTAPKSMLSVMLMRMQETDMSHENLCDLVGEITNTLSGNARRDYGQQFQNLRAIDRRRARRQDSNILRPADR